MPDPDPSDITNRSGGVDVGDNANVGGDVVGRDKIESSGGHIIHAEAGATVIIGEHPTLALPDLSSAPGEPPFKGLQYFDVADAALFFGRERLTAKLAGLLREQRFLAIAGASGCGKSSVVRAGLIPALQRGEPLADGTLPPADSPRWPVHIITPTAHPLEALAASLTQDSESVTATTTLMDDLARDPRSLHLAVRRVLSRTAADRFSPDGKWVVTAYWDGTARVWEAATGKDVAVLRGHEGLVTSAQFSPDDKWVVTAGDTTARVYVVHLEDLLALARTRVTRQLTCDERVQYLHEGRACPTPTLAATATP